MPLEQISKHILFGQFINRLKEEIRAEIRLLNPINLEQAMDVALRVEERNRTGGPRRNIISSV